jgi:menaquinone-specific isochorismate synthase
MSEKYESTLKNALFSDFVKSGFIVQKPFSKEIWIGIGKGTNACGGTFLSNFFQTSFRYIPSDYVVKTDIDTFSNWVITNSAEKLKIKFTNDLDDKYEVDVKKSIDWINDADPLEKLVSVTRAFFKGENDEHPITQIEKLRCLNGSLYGYWDSDHGTLGVSPEPLFYKNNKTYKTIALAGTISTDIENYEQIIFSDDKEINEHNLVIKDIVSKLDGFSNSIVTKDTHCFNFGPFAHLKTEIEFSLDNIKVKDLVRSLGPTAALGGYPSKLTFSYLPKLNYYQYDGDQREFGGVIGLDTDEESFGLVMIRNINWIKNQYIIDSGSGIVSDSNPISERSEVKRKRQSIESIYCDRNS